MEALFLTEVSQGKLADTAPSINSPVVGEIPLQDKHLRELDAVINKARIVASHLHRVHLIHGVKKLRRRRIPLGWPRRGRGLHPVQELLLGQLRRFRFVSARECHNIA